MRAALLLVVLCGCGPSSTHSRFGHFTVETKSDALATLSGTLRVSVGGVAAYDVQRVDERTVRFTVQGAPETGNADIVARTASGSVKIGTLYYSAPADARLERLVAFGASLTMGSQDASISQRAQLMGPAAQLARATGAYLPLPLVKTGTLPALEVRDIDPVACRARDANVFEVIGSRVQAELIEKLKDSNGDVAIAKARLDPAIEVRNVAIGGFRVSETIGGAQSFFGRVLEHLVWDAQVDSAGLVEPPKETMIDRVVALRPTTLLTTDLFGNDFNNVNVYAPGVPDLAPLTSTADMRASLKAVLDRLEPLGAELFIATGPDATLLPQYDAKIAALKAEGFSDADATGWRDTLRARIGEYNAVLREEAAARPWVHVVELAAKVDDVVQHGVEVGGAHLEGSPFGGLFSLDSMHFSDTGYAVLANLFLDAMDAAWGTKLPRVDPAEVMKADPSSVEALRKAGLHCAGQ